MGGGRQADGHAGGRLTATRLAIWGEGRKKGAPEGARWLAFEKFIEGVPDEDAADRAHLADDHYELCGHLGHHAM